MSAILWHTHVRANVGAQADAWVVARKRRDDTSVGAARTSAYATMLRGFF
jgi:hypothetical protein